MPEAHGRCGDDVHQADGQVVLSSQQSKEAATDGLQSEYRQSAAHVSITITALQSANDHGRNALDVLDQRVGWDRLLRMKPELESMVEDNETAPLTVAAEQYATSTNTRCVPSGLHVPLGASPRPASRAIALLNAPPCREAADTPGSHPAHPPQPDRSALIFEQEKPIAVFYEIATLAALRDRL